MFSLKNSACKRLSLLYKSNPNLIELMDLSIFNNSILKIDPWNVDIQCATFSISFRKHALGPRIYSTNGHEFQSSDSVV